ncbi:hypothetical protein Tco_1562879 [Tanacetum coccineum]
MCTYLKNMAGFTHSQLKNKSFDKVQKAFDKTMGWKDSFVLLGSKDFMIETNLFNYETSLCKEFKEFNYLLKIDPDLLTKDIKGFKTYEEFKEDWIYEWNKDVPWVDEKPWIDTGDYEWYKALEDSELKENALRNKAIMEGLIDDDNDDESPNEREELCEIHELPVCTIRRFEMIKYSFRQDEE